MTKQVLDVNQMQHLQELGLELKETTLIYAGGGGKYGLFLTKQIDKILWESTYPAYTLQDVLDALPASIGDDEGDVYWLQIEKMDMKNDDWRVSYLFFSQHKYFHCFQSQHLIDAAYEMLCWAIENKFVETNKNE